MSVKNLEKMAEMLESGTMLRMEQGLEHLDTQEMGCIIDMIKDLAEAKYRCQIVDAMKKSEESTYPLDEEDEEDMGRVFYTRARDSRGRYMSKHYTEPNYQMTPEMYRKHSPEELRDMDRRGGRLYFTESNNGGSRYDSARKNYTEHKQTNPNDENGNVKGVEMLTNTIMDDIRELLPKMSHSEKTMLKTKMTNMANEIM